MKVIVVFLVLAIAEVKAADRNRLQVRPTGMENLELEKYMGKWYLYAEMLPCSWKGAAQFNDWVYTQRMDSNGQSFTVEDTWRKDGTCTTTSTKATMTSTAGMTIVDQLGDVWSGVNVVMYTDYRNYVITWGCTKESVHTGVCDDFYVSVKTRNPSISQKYIDEIQQLLHKNWGIDLSEMVHIAHKNPCGQSVQSSGRMFKTYG